MDMKNLVDRAKDLVEERKDGLNEDIAELKDIAQGEGSLLDKAKDAVEAIKDPGAPGEDAPK